MKRKNSIVNRRHFLKQTVAIGSAATLPMLFQQTHAAETDSNITPLQRPVTRQQLEIGLKQLKEWYPQEASLFDQHKAVVYDHLLNRTEISLSDPLWSAQHIVKPQEITVKAVSLSQCQRDLIDCTVEGITFAFTVAGFFRADRFGKWLDRYVTSIFFDVPKYEREIQPLINVLAAAEGATAKAKAFVPIADKIWKYGLFRGSFDVIKGKSTWGEWFVSTLAVIGQIVIWAGTEFIAAVAEFALLILSAIHMLLTVRDTVKACR